MKGHASDDILKHIYPNILLTPEGTAAAMEATEAAEAAEAAVAAVAGQGTAGGSCASMSASRALWARMRRRAVMSGGCGGPSSWSSTFALPVVGSGGVYRGCGGGLVRPSSSIHPSTQPLRRCTHPPTLLLLLFLLPRDRHVAALRQAAQRVEGAAPPGRVEGEERRGLGGEGGRRRCGGQSHLKAGGRPG